jgi:hypothetical protein
MVRAALLAAGLVAAAPAALAHPEGVLDCAVRVAFGAKGLAGVELELTLDPVSSKKVLANHTLDSAGVPSGAPATALRDAMRELLQTSGWMLDLRPAGTASPLALTEAAPLALRRETNGQLAIQARLAPVGEAPAATAWRVVCRDPTWYWFAGFTRPDQLQAPGCSVALGELQGSGAAPESATEKDEEHGDAPHAAPRAQEAQLTCTGRG